MFGFIFNKMSSFEGIEDINERLLVVSDGTPVIFNNRNQLELPVNNHPRKYITDQGLIIINPSIRIKQSVNTHQTDASITSDPVMFRNLFASGTTIVSSGSFFLSEGYYLSTNEGSNWNGYDTLPSLPMGNHAGSPTTIIDKNGVLMINHLTGIINQSVSISRSTNFGVNWESYLTVSNSNSNSTASATTDNNPLSPYYGNTYSFWTDFSNPSERVIKFSKSLDSGISWSNPVQLNTPTSPYPASQGISSVVGNDGVIYAVWRDHAIVSPFTGKRVGFGISTDGANSWLIDNEAFTMNGIRSPSLSPYNIRVNDFPKIAIDKSNGVYNDRLYVITPQEDQMPAGTDPDIILTRSTDGGVTWLPGVRVNQDPINNGKIQFMPAICVDNFGFVNVIYFDNRNTSSDSAEVFIARSSDGGDTWDEFVLSNHRFKPSPIQGIAGSYGGDYIDIVASGSFVYPIWMDNSTGNYQLWSTQVININFPLNNFHLNDPGSGQIFTSSYKAQDSIKFEWDTSATGAIYRFSVRDTATNQLILEASSSKNFYYIKLQQLDNILIQNGLLPGDTIHCTWNVTAFRQTPNGTDSLSSQNGPWRVSFIRGTPMMTPFSLKYPLPDTTVFTNVSSMQRTSFNWGSAGNGNTYRFVMKIPELDSGYILNLQSLQNGYDSSFALENSDMDIVLMNKSVNIEDTVNGIWTVYSNNGYDSIKAVDSNTISFVRISPPPVFFDGFVNGLVNWQVENLGGDCIWGIENEPYSNHYNMKFTSISPLLSANLKACGPQTVIRSMLSISDNINCTNRFNNFLLVDCDIFNLAPSDTARIEVSYDGGISWESALSMSDITLRNIRLVVELPDAFDNPLLKFRFFTSLSNGIKWWTIDNVIVTGDYIISSGESNPELIRDYSLGQNFPNPFNPITTIKYSLPEKSNIELSIFDITGRVISVLDKGVKEKGIYEVKFDAGRLPSGIYFYRLKSESIIITKKLVVIK